MANIKYDDFTNLDIRIGTVIHAERPEGADRLIKTIIDFGEYKRQVVAGFGKFLSPEDLIGKQVPVVVNIDPTEIRGIKSEGIFVAIDPAGAVLLIPEKQVPNASKVR